MFLAWVMNQSKQWTVGHERHLKEDRFDTPYYGEVNSNLRFFVKDLDVPNRGVLLRDPVELVVSMMNRRDPSQWDNSLANINTALIIISYCIQSGFYPIDFSLMTTQVDYLQMVIEDFGIEDVKVTEPMIQTVKNPTKSNDFTYNELSLKQKTFVEAMESNFVLF